VKKPLLSEQELMLIYNNNFHGLYEEKYLPTPTIHNMYHDIRFYQRQVKEMQKALEQAKTALKWATEYHTKTCTCVECEGLGVVIHTLHIVKGGESNA
jgi:hypothetical protein